MWRPIFVLINIIIVTYSHPLVESLTPYIPRDLAGLFEGDVFTSESSQKAATSTGTVFSSRIASRTPGGIVTSEAKPPKTTPTTDIGTSHSIIGTLPTDNTTPAAQSMMATFSLTSPSASAVTSAGATPEAARMPPGEAAEWKVIGLVVICISFVAVTILSIVFFDCWWGFLRDLTCGKRRRGGVEDLVPDWEKRSWEFKLGNEDGHRYPTLASLEYIVKERTEGDRDSSTVYPADSHPRPYPELVSPRTAHLPDWDPHPLEPFSRRPSTRQTTTPQART